MTLSARRVYLRILAVLAIIVGFFLLLQETVRGIESDVVAQLLQWFGFEGSQVVLDTNVAIFADDDGWLLASITPSCSALASVLALSCLAAVAPIGSIKRRAVAVSLAIAVIVVGNFVRMTASLALGVVAGRDALLLFHDWVGGLCTFTYTLIGYVLFLYVMLPSEKRRATLRHHAVPV